MNHIQRLDFLIRELLAEQPRYSNVEIPIKIEDKKQLFRSLCNVRLPSAISEKFLETQNRYLKEEITNKGITDIADLTPVQKNIYLWQGDITTLKVDAIVNAANSQLVGCFVPGYGCIDNAIHSFAGIQLRNDCAEIMKKQKTHEETGRAKITPAYNLPSKYVLHTVGPIINETLTQRDCDFLSSCYRSCLQLAEENGVKSIAFCCISTGEFHFPNEKAAEIAINTTKAYLKQTSSSTQIVFNVFKENDYEIYKRLLRKN